MEILGLLVAQFVMVCCLYWHIRTYRKSLSDLGARVKQYVGSVSSLIGRIESHIGRVENRVLGELARAQINAKLADKCAERAMSLASGANIATIAIQRSLYSGSRFPTKEQVKRDTLARKKVSDILGSSEWDYLKPLLNDQELDVLEKALEHTVKFNESGN